MKDDILKNIEMLPDEVEFVTDLKAIVYTAKAKAYQPLTSTTWSAIGLWTDASLNKNNMERLAPNMGNT